MNDDHERLSVSDGAYVLGALCASDRAEFEAHLETCAACRASVAELAPTAGPGIAASAPPSSSKKMILRISRLDPL